MEDVSIDSTTALNQGVARGPKDHLTGLAARHSLIDSLAALLRDAQPGQAGPGLVLLDLEDFKNVNDGLGPKIGDELLCRIALRLRSAMPENAVLARVSGDGFGALLYDGSTAAAIAAKMHDLVGRPYAIAGKVISMGASFGIAIGGPDGTDALEVYRAADIALHHAQRSGQNRICHFSPDMLQDAGVRQSLDDDLRAAVSMQEIDLLRALQSQQFSVSYQPTISLSDGGIVGFEALLRWDHPVRGPISPAQFIPLAEKAGLINLIGEWILKRACCDATTWQSSYDTPLRVAVNVSPIQLVEGGALLAAIANALRASKLPPDRLEIELTETALESDILDTLAAIRGLGVSLALDDFGTGYSSLSRLHMYPFTRLKIDRSFAADLSDGRPDDAQRDSEWLIRAIAALGRGLGIDTVIEGNETPYQLAIARRSGCSEMQGYLTSRPVPAANVNYLIAMIESEQRQEAK